MDLERLRRGRARRRRRLAAAAGLLTVAVAAAGTAVVSDVEEQRVAPKAVGAVARPSDDPTTGSTQAAAPSAVLRPVTVPDGLSRGS